MKYDDKTVTIQQKRSAQSFIDSVIDGFQLQKPPNYVIYGLTSDEDFAELEFQKVGKNQKEIKKIEKKIKSIQDYLSWYIKVFFEFDRNPRKIIGLSNRFKTSKTYCSRYSWIGFLDFPISSSFIFGRVSKIKRHGGGNYYFAPFEELKSRIAEDIRILEKKIPDISPYDIIESKRFTNLLEGFKFNSTAINKLGTMPRIIKSESKTTPLVDALNQLKDLKKIMEKIPHFGTVRYFMYKFASQVDISTLFVPYKNVTFFHIDLFGSAPKEHFRAISALIESLEDLHKK